MSNVHKTDPGDLLEHVHRPQYHQRDVHSTLEPMFVQRARITNKIPSNNSSMDVRV